MECPLLQVVSTYFGKSEKTTRIILAWMMRRTF